MRREGRREREEVVAGGRCYGPGKKNCMKRNRCFSVSDCTSRLPESFSSSNAVRISLRDITIAAVIVTCHKIARPSDALSSSIRTDTLNRVYGKRTFISRKCDLIVRRMFATGIADECAVMRFIKIARGRGEERGRCKKILNI